MVGAMDDEMLRDLVAHDFHCWRMNTGITKHDLGWGSQNFHLMGRWVTTVRQPHPPAWAGGLGVSRGARQVGDE